MLIKDLKNEKFEFDEVSVIENSEIGKWEIKHKNVIIFDEFITKEEAKCWAIKISKKVNG